MSVQDSKPTLEDRAARVAERFWAERAKGRVPSVDEVLGVSPGDEGYEALRQSAIRAIAQHAATLPPDGARGAATVVGVNTEDSVITGGPMPTIEGYELVSCLGRGGMGAVFEGYQQSTGRRVAVKFMLDSGAASAAAKKRFEREVEVVARLQHPGIVSVIDSGVRKGRYFYVMEYVAGRPLDAAMKPGDCGLREAMTLIARVCDAVDYAHQRGVLHRDLKPSNIIVDDQGLPHLLDFGLAKVLDEGGSERHGAMGLTVSGPGQLMGTVAYMSPEQAHGRHDETSVRTDVYSLGAIAFELASGFLPCSTEGSLRDVLERITSVDPAAPSTLRPGITRDLDAVLLRALEKAPEQRYATAGEFAADLRRSLAGEPVTARRISAAGRAWRWVGRNRAISTVAGVGLVTLVVVSTLLIARIITETHRAQRERDLALDSFSRLRAMLEAADPDRTPGMTLLPLLDAASKTLDDTPPQQQLSEAAIRDVLGIVYRKYEAFTKALQQQARVLELRERNANGRDDPGLAEALHNLGATLWWDGQYEEATKHYTRSLEMRRRLYKGDHQLVALSLTHLAACYLKTGKLGEARSFYKEALAMRRRLNGNEAEEVAGSLNNLARCYMEGDNIDQAEDLFRESLEMIRKLRGDMYNGTAAASQNLAECLLHRAQAAQIAGDSAAAARAMADARPLLNRALEIRKATYVKGHALTGATLGWLSRLSLMQEDIPAALDYAQQSVDMIKKSRRPDHPDVAESLATQGSALLAAADYTAASKALEQALTIAERARPRMELPAARIRGEFGLALARTGRVDDAVVAVQRGLAETRAIRGDSSIDTVFAARRVLECSQLTGKPAATSELRALAKVP